MILDFKQGYIRACPAAVWCDTCNVAWVCGHWRETHKSAAVSERTLKDVAVVQV